MKLTDCLDGSLCGSGFVVEIEGQVLFVEALFAKVKELQLPGEVLSDNVLDLLQHRGLVDVPVDLGKYVDLL